MKDAVGPVLRMGGEIDLFIRAIEDDNPGREIVVIDQGAYVRVQAAGSLRVTLPTLRSYLGASFEMRQLESLLAAFAGKIATTSDEITWTLAETAATGLEEPKEEPR
jgi:toluene monooxygenase system protein D